MLAPDSRTLSWYTDIQLRGLTGCFRCEDED
jgi:hypothetical protein